MQQIIHYAIYVHAFFGGCGLLSGFVSVAVKKGGENHKKTGMVFSVSMIISAFISLIIAVLPKHENPFLFSIGVFTIYMILAGNRFLTFKNKKKIAANNMDKIVSGGMFVCGIAMVGFGLYLLSLKISGGILYLFFGGIGLFMSISDFRTFKKIQANRKLWLIQHIGRMVGAFIASITAFIVAGLNIGTLAAWMAPTLIGTPYIIYWIRKVKGPKAKTDNLHFNIQ